MIYPTGGQGGLPADLRIQGRADSLHAENACSAAGRITAGGARLRFNKPHEARDQGCSCARFKLFLPHDPHLHEKRSISIVAKASPEPPCNSPAIRRIDQRKFAVINHVGEDVG